MLVDLASFLLIYLIVRRSGMEIESDCIVIRSLRTRRLARDSLESIRVESNGFFVVGVVIYTLDGGRHAAPAPIRLLNPNFDDEFSFLMQWMNGDFG